MVEDKNYFNNFRSYYEKRAKIGLYYKLSYNRVKQPSLCSKRINE